MHQDAPDERVMLLLDGRVKVARVDEGGHELMLGIRDPGDLLGELGFIDRRPRVAAVTALEPVVVSVMSAATFRAHLEGVPRVAGALLEVMASRVRETTLHSLRFATADTLGRLSARILDLAERYGEPTDGGIPVDLPISQEELAAWTGASRAAVGQSLQMMRELGWIRTQRMKLVVRDLEALRGRAAR